MCGGSRQTELQPGAVQRIWWCPHPLRAVLAPSHSHSTHETAMLPLPGFHGWPYLQACGRDPEA